MPSRLKTLIQYLVIITVTVLLIWFSLRGLKVGEDENKWDYLMNTWQQANKGWLLVMAGIAVLSHILRAERWRMLIAPAGYQTSLTNSFLSVMVGYLINLAIPRGGEVSRCYNLYRLNKIPVDISFGTVVVERVIDVLCLAALVFAAFLLESNKLFAFLNTLPATTSGTENSRIMAILYLIAGGVAITIVLLWIIRRNQKIRSFLLRTWDGIKKGLLTVFHLKNKSLFILYSVVIWVLYFLMSYAVILAFPSTKDLGLGAVVSLFAIGSIAMTVPLPGGTGSYHTLVPAGLTFLYMVPQTDAVAFTFIFHGWQTLIMIIGGALSLVITSVKTPKH